MATGRDMPREVFDKALADAIDAAALEQNIRPTRWTPAIDAQIWRAHQVLGMGARRIAEVMRNVHGWGSRDSVQRRLVLIRKHGGPDKVPR